MGVPSNSRDFNISYRKSTTVYNNLKFVGYSMGTGKDRGGGKECGGVRACVLQIRRCGNQSGVSMETLGEETRIASLLKSFCG